MKILVDPPKGKTLKQLLYEYGERKRMEKQKEKEKKKQEEKQENQEEREFKELMKLYLEQLISIFYPVQIVWYEMVITIVMGFLFGLGMGYIVKHIMIYYGVIPWK